MVYGRMITPQQIKKALVRLAEFKGRPHYDPVAVRHIIENFETHPLREAILYFADTSPAEEALRYMDLARICPNKAMISLASRITGVDIKAVLDGHIKITNALWQHLQKHFDVLDDVSETQVKLKEDFEHECSFDMWLQLSVQEAEFNWHTMLYDDKELNESWLSFQDFRSGTQ